MKYRYILGLWLAILLSACQPVQPSPTPIQTLPPTATVPLPTEAPTPTLTPTPLTPLAVLIQPEGADSALVDLLEPLVYEQVIAAGLRWQVRPALTPQDLTPELRLLVALPPLDNLSALVAAAPQAQFLAIGFNGLEAAPNLTTVGLGNDRPDQAGFIAGAITAMITPDYRIGMLGLKDNVAAKAASQAFRYGRSYYCGLCLPEYPPFYEYPVYMELPAGASPAEWQVVANSMLDYQVKTVFVFPGAGEDASLKFLAEAGVALLGINSPPEALRPRWVASLRVDPIPIIQNILPDLLNGKSLGNVFVPLAIADPNPDLFSPGRQRLANEILADLLAGFVDTRVDPLTGESK